MPIYEFLCPHCQKQFEELCQFSAAENMHCPVCGKPAQRRLSAFAFKNGTNFKASTSGGGCSSCGGGSCASCGH